MDAVDLLVLNLFGLFFIAVLLLSFSAGWFCDVIDRLAEIKEAVPGKADRHLILSNVPEITEWGFYGKAIDLLNQQHRTGRHWRNTQEQSEHVSQTVTAHYQTVCATIVQQERMVKKLKDDKQAIENMWPELVIMPSQPGNRAEEEQLVSSDMLIPEFG